MARHLVKNEPGLFSRILGTGWVETQCGMQVPVSNGPDTGQDVTCGECQKTKPEKMFLNWF